MFDQYSFASMTEWLWFCVIHLSKEMLVRVFLWGLATIFFQVGTPKVKKHFFMHCSGLNILVIRDVSLRLTAPSWLILDSVMRCHGHCEEGEDWVVRCATILIKNGDWQLYLIRREANGMADALAKEALEKD